MKRPEEFSSKEISEAASILKKGGVVIFPTDTVYGIGCRWNNKKAIARIYQIKETPKSQPLPILVSSVSQAAALTQMTPQAKQLIKDHWPGGLTIIVKSKDNKKIGLRIPNSSLVLSLIKKVGVPIVGTSANFHGELPPTSFDDLNPKIVSLVDYVILGECQNKVPSTVVDATAVPPKILRQGAVKLDDLPAGHRLRDRSDSRSRQVLKIDTTKTGEITVELVDKPSGKKFRLTQKQKMGSQVLLPLIAKILKKHDLNFSDLTQIKVNPGPGSFTGTRVGVTVANALGFALKVPVNGSPRGEAGKRGKIVAPVYQKSKFDSQN